MKNLKTFFFIFFVLNSQFVRASDPREHRKICRRNLALFFGEEYKRLLDRANTPFKQQLKRLSKSSYFQFQYQSADIIEGYRSYQREVQKRNILWSIQNYFNVTQVAATKILDLLLNSTTIFFETAHLRATPSVVQSFLEKWDFNGLFYFDAVENQAKPKIFILVPSWFRGSEIVDILFVHEMTHYFQKVFIQRNESIQRNQFIYSSPIGKELSYLFESSAILNEWEFILRLPQERREQMQVDIRRYFYQEWRIDLTHDDIEQIINSLLDAFSSNEYNREIHMKNIPRSEIEMKLMFFAIYDQLELANRFPYFSALELLKRQRSFRSYSKSHIIKKTNWASHPQTR